jgi:uncharacterized protein YqeY
MSDLKDRLQGDLTTAMKARDELRTATLRMALTAVKTEEVAGGAARALTDDEVLKVLAREAKKRRESATAYTDAGRAELAEREDAERAVIEAYLPQQLGDDELDALVRAAVEEAGATSPQQMGAVMKRVTPRVAGRAEGGRVAAAVKKALGAG